MKLLVLLLFLDLSLSLDGEQIMTQLEKEMYVISFINSVSVAVLIHQFAGNGEQGCSACQLGL